ncbi:MAG TPA: hypothetical protein VHE35_27485 [Kofleriaceae bacterium]|nr:hypothetical protein [Kofleriaceae bacterium]
MRARALAVAAAAASLAAAVPAARADDWSWLGPSRRIARTWSASRDTPAMNLLILPRDVRTAGGELAFVTIPRASVTLRLGFAGLLELESDGETHGFGLFPRADGAILWRGSYAYYAAVAFDRLAARLCDGCALELTGQVRHESQHYTGSNAGDAGMDVSAEPFVGDDLLVDVAAAREHGDWRTAARVTAMVYLPGRSSYAAGAGLDLHLRWTGWRRVHPFVSAYGEYQLGDDLEGRRFPDAYLVRALAGVALPSALGDTMLYVSADVGDRKGIRMLTEEATLGLGVRLALGAAPPPAR